MTYTEEERAAMARPDPALTEALKQRPFPDVTGGTPDFTIQTIRTNRANHLAGLRHLYPIPGPIPDRVHEADHKVKARDGHEVPIRIYTPVTSSTSSPLIVLFHEGGWCLGDLTDEEHDARAFTSEFGAVCVNVDYRLAPEHAFPTGLNDCYDVLKWCAANASPDNKLLPADPKAGFVLGGASAGANFTAVVSQLARDDGLSPPLTGQYLAVPGLMATYVCPEKWKPEFKSRISNRSDPVLDLKDEAGFMQALRAEPSDPKLSPLLHANLKGLPPAYFQVCGMDPLRDEGLLYERVLREENDTKTKIDLYPGFGHMFWTNWPELERSKDFFADTIKGMKWLLSQS